MVKLRLKRLGRKKHPFYRIVAMNANAPRSGQALAELGTYDPMAAVFDLDEEAALQWLRNGAQMSETVHDLLKSKGTLAKYAGEEGVEKEGALSHDKPKRRKKLASSSAPAAEEAVAEAPAEEAVADSANAAETPATEEAATEPPAEGEATDES
ncbi:MAG: 30S ribosomal protein S16 [Candidatus Latescibacterota bacterium]|nr:30S ribosomal protein S16 [Candidatus Latescibacterota bacterium]